MYCVDKGFGWNKRTGGKYFFFFLGEKSMLGENLKIQKFGRRKMNVGGIFFQHKKHAAPFIWETRVLGLR